MCDYHKPIDIALKIYRARQVWVKSEAPTIMVIGEEKKFGKIVLSFPDESYFWNIYIKNKTELELDCKFALDNFSYLIKTHFKDNYYNM